MGRPKGYWSEKRFRDALSISVSELTDDGKTKLRAIADKLTDCALAGESWAVEQVANRLDGKPAQDINVDSTVTHELASLSDTELAGRIKAELASLAGRGEATADKGKLH